MKSSLSAFVFSLLFLFTSFTAAAQDEETHHHHHGDGINGQEAPPKARRNSYLTDTTISCGIFSGSYAFQLPGGDLAKRFGPNSNVATTLWYKTEKNLLFSLQLSFMFGNNIRENGILDSISTSDGHVINKEGKFADIIMYERGFSLTLGFGKVCNTFLSPNKNSGPLFMINAGYLQHRIKINDRDKVAPQLSGDYIRGYDRLTAGPAFSETIGYFFMSKNRYTNFYGGFEFTEGLTRSMRPWDFDLMKKESQLRFDLLSGFRVGWCILIDRRETNTYYYY